MTDFRIVPSVEPTDKYQKAKSDLITAIRSFNELNDSQKHQLLCELFEAARVDYLMRLFNKNINLK